MEKTSPRSKSTKITTSPVSINNTPPRPPRPEFFDKSILSCSPSKADDNSDSPPSSKTHIEIPPKPEHVRRKSILLTSKGSPEIKIKRLYSKSTVFESSPVRFDNDNHENCEKKDTDIKAESTPILAPSSHKSPLIRRKKSSSSSRDKESPKNDSNHDDVLDERGRRFTEGKPRTSDFYNLGVNEKKSKLSFKGFTKGIKELFPSKQHENSNNNTNNSPPQTYDEGVSMIFMLWISNKRPIQKWNKIDLSIVPSDILSIVNVSILDDGHHVEFGEQIHTEEQNEESKIIKSNITTHFQEEEGAIDVAFKSEYIPFYTFYLYPIDYTYFVGYDEDTRSHWIISVEDKPTNKQRDIVRVLVRSKRGYYRYCIDQVNSSSGNRLTPLYKFIPEIENIKFTKVKSPELCEELHSMEMKEVSLGSRYKFGILYVKPNQTEDEIYANNELTSDFEEFLNFLGEKIELKGWTKYNGGLDTKSDSTGTHSHFTSIHGAEIMFHVCPLLPSQIDDVQRVERKRHIGNDVVVFIFLEDGCEPYLSTLLTSKFIHIHIVVQKIKKKSEEELTRYKIAVITKSGVEPHKPALPATSIIEKTPEDRLLLLTKAINAERTTMLSPEFKTKMVRTRQDFLNHLYDSYSSTKKKK